MLGATYSLITKTLWQGMRDEKSSKQDTTYDTTQSCKYIINIKCLCFALMFVLFFNLYFTKVKVNNGKMALLPQ